MNRVLWLTLALLAGVAGCSGSEPGAVPAASFVDDKEAVAVSNLVEEFNDKKFDPKAVAGFFAKGAAPKDAKGFRGLDVSPAGKPTVTGTTATCKVNVATKSGAETAMDWMFEKDGDKWKIKSAPLPAGK